MIEARIYVLVAETVLALDSVRSGLSQALGLCSLRRLDWLRLIQIPEMP